MLINNKNNKGFTLIELMVSITLFSIVVSMSLGSIITMFDVNRKARSLMTVMNNLNFAVDSITRSFQTGSSPFITNTNGYTDCIKTNEKNLEDINTAMDADQARSVYYCFDDSSSKGKIVKVIGVNAYDITSPDIDIDEASFDIINVGNSPNKQPILLLNIQGTVSPSPKISSPFHIQTSISQRDLEI